MTLQALRAWAEAHQVVSLKGADLERETWLSHWDAPLETLPEEIGLLRALIRIDLRHNGLQTLPQSLGQLHRLEDLTSMGNALEHLPDVFHHLKRLRYLDLRENRLQSLPASLGALESLKGLILRDNCLTALPPQIGQLKRLQQLDLSRNPLQCLPPELQHCESLVHLDISGTLIDHLPEWLGEMRALKHLIRGPNRVAEINRALAEDAELSGYADKRHPYIVPPEIDNEPFKLWFERALAADAYGPLKIAFRHILQQDLSDAEIASKARGVVGSEDWPEGWFVWGADEGGEYIEYYLTSRWGDQHGRIDRDGSHSELPALWQMGPIDEEYEALQRELMAKGLLDG
jgi:hypothetical protein